MSDLVVRHKPQSVVAEAPLRVVSLVPSMTETLFDLGLGERLVGITDDCLYPEGELDSKYRVGDMDAVLVDDVVGLRPDLVITDREDNAPEDIAELESAGLTVWKTFPLTVIDAMNLIWDTLHTFQVEDRMLYERVNLIHRTIDWVGSASEARAASDFECRVFLPLLPEPLTTISAMTYAHDLIETAGGTNVFADVLVDAGASDLAQDATRYPQVTMEQVETAQPDVIILPGFPLGFREEDVSWFMELDVPAAANEQIYVVDGSLIVYHGTRLARALNELSALMCQTEE